MTDISRNIVHVWNVFNIFTATLLQYYLPRCLSSKRNFITADVREDFPKESILLPVHIQRWDADKTCSLSEKSSEISACPWRVIRHSVTNSIENSKTTRGNCWVIMRLTREADYGSLSVSDIMILDWRGKLMNFNKVISNDLGRTM